MKRKTAWSVLSGVLLFVSCLGLVRADSIRPWSIIDDQQRFVFYPNASDQNATLVYDRATGLIWQRSPTSATTTWGFANYSCQALWYPAAVSGASHGFRLPKVEELSDLQRLVSLTERPTGGNDLITQPASDKFTNINGSYWTATESTLSVDPSATAFTVLFGVSPIFAGPSAISGIGSVSKDSSTVKFWCVRGGTN